MSGRSSVTVALALACVATARAGPGAAAAPSEFRTLALASGLRVLVGTEPHASFLEGVLVVQAGSGGEESPLARDAGILAEGFLAGRAGDHPATIRQRLAREGATADHTVGREVAVFRFAVPARRSASFLRLLAAILRRERLAADVWREAALRHEADEASREVDAWQESVRTLERVLWREPSSETPAAAAHASDGDVSALEARWLGTYAPERMVLGLWSGLDAAELARLAEAELGELPARAAGPAFAPPDEPRLQDVRDEIRCLQTPGAAPPVLLVGLGSELRDETSFYAWQLIAHVLGASHSSRLHERLRAREQLLYTVEAACTPVGSHGLTLRVAAQTDALARVRAIILEEIERLRREELSAREVEIGKAILRSRLWLDGDSLQQRFYREALALLLPGRQRAAARGKDALDTLDPASLLAIARRTLRPESAATLVVSADAQAICDGGRP